MKKISLLLLFVCFVFVAFAQKPMQTSYVFEVRNASNNLVLNSAVKVQLTVLQGSETGTTVYQETHSVTTNAYGTASVELGTGTASVGTYASQTWNSQPYYLKAAIDPDGGTNYTYNAGTTPMTISTTSTMVLQRSGAQLQLAPVAVSGSYTDLTNKPDIAAAQVQSDWNATSGMGEILNKPSIPTTVAELTDAGDYAKLAADNTFSGNNDFTAGTTKVASVADEFSQMLASPDCNIAVNYCGLNAIFDSLQKNLAALRSEIDQLRDTLSQLSNTTPPTGTLSLSRTENSITAVANFTAGVSAITGYEYCISPNNTMSPSTCTSTTSSTNVFTGLSAGTRYYLTATATNIAGTSDAASADATTLHIYNITYALNGGTGGPSDTTAVEGTSFTISSTIPTKTGKNFGGWSDGTNTYNALQGWDIAAMANDVTLMALWIPDVSSTLMVTYKNGDSYTSNSTLTEPQGSQLTIEEVAE